MNLSNVPVYLAFMRRQQITIIFEVRFHVATILQQFQVNDYQVAEWHQAAASTVWLPTCLASKLTTCSSNQINSSGLATMQGSVSALPLSAVTCNSANTSSSDWCSRWLLIHCTIRLQLARGQATSHGLLLTAPLPGVCWCVAMCPLLRPELGRGRVSCKYQAKGILTLLHAGDGQTGSSSLKFLW